jgi:hypothetical protein
MATKGVIRSQLVVLSPDANGIVRIDLGTLQQHVCEIQATCDAGTIVSVATSPGAKLAGQMGTRIDPSGATGDRTFKLSGPPDYKRADILYFTFESNLTTGRLYVWLSSYETQ